MPHNPHADFSPTLKGYTGQEPFRFWCQLALPLTFDDSLSYYELLNKVVVYLNNTIKDVANVEENVDALNTAFNNLQNYVNEYFDTIDIEAELKNVLDNMAEDGSLNSLLDPLVAARLGDVVADQINAVVANQIENVVSQQIGGTVAEQLPDLADNIIPDAVTDWLDENVTPTSPVVDNTLTISGAAADAKVTGDNITDLKEQLNLTGAIGGNWVRGRIGTDGANVNSDYDLRENDYIPVSSYRKIHVEFPEVLSGLTDYNYYIWEYSGNTPATKIQNQILTQESNEATLDDNTNYIRMQIRGVPFNTVVLPSDFYKFFAVLYSDGSIFRVAEDAKTDLETTTNDLKTQSTYPYGPLETNTDVDTIDTNGRWWVSPNNAYTHLPDGMTNGMLISMKASPVGTSVRMQIAYSDNDGKIYFRYRISSGWGEWKDNLAELADRIQTIAGDNTGVYTRTSMYRNIEIPLSTVPGDRIVMVPIYWDGPQNSGFRLIGMKDGVQIITDYKANYLFDVVTADITDSFDSLRVGVGCDSLSTDVTFKVLVFKVGNDMLSPFNFGLGNEITQKPINLYHRSEDTKGYFIDENGTLQASVYFRYTTYYKVTPGKNYYLFTHSIGDGTSGVRVHAYDSALSWIKQIAYKSLPNGTEGDIIINFTIPSNAEYIRFSIRQSNTDTYIGEGEYNKILGINANNGKLTLSVIKNPDFIGKKLSILGASISTYSDYIPAGYSAYYPHETTNANPVTDVHDTYWQKVIDATGMELLVNNSSAGSYCSTGHGNDAMAGCGDRCTSLDKDGVNPDYIIIQLGGNDFTRNTPCDESVWDALSPIPDYSTLETNKFEDAYAVMLDKITKKYKNAHVLCGLIPVISGGSYVSSKPPAFNTANIPLHRYNEIIRKYAALFNCAIIDWESCGLTFNNTSVYMQDASGTYGQHPNKFGHSMMANAVLHTLGQDFGKLYPIS